MFRAAMIGLCLLFFSAITQAQTTVCEAKTMEALLTEIRQLRQDLQAAATAARKAQIVIYRLHVQVAAAEHAAAQLESAKNERTQMQWQVQYQTLQIKRLEEMKERAETEEQRKQFDESISAFRAGLEMLGPKEQELQANEIEKEAELRIQQAKLDQLESELDRIENTLGNSALEVRRAPVKEN